MTDLSKFDFTEINKSFSEFDFVQKTIDQINKDLLGLSSENISNFSFNSVNVLNDLIDAIAPILNSLSKQTPEHLSQFIYKVDLNEAKFINSLQEDISLKKLGALVIEREALKVYLKTNYS